MNLVKIGLVALGGYLAYDYMTKRKKNKETVEAVVAGKPVVSPAVVEAAMEEEGEEGAAVAMADTREVEAMSNANGWDSDTISTGL